ncbi:MAG TPA: VWA domain-containing protein [Pyrinomonadaceae bacterium]
MKIEFGVLGLILALAFSAFAQTPQTTPPPVEDNDVIRVESRLVIVPVSITDSAGQPVLNLKKEDFLVREENKQQEVAQISDAEKVPLEIALLFDISASTDSMFKFQQETAAKFLQDVMRPDDRATIFTVGANATLIQARDSADKSAVAIRSIIPTKEQTAFYDAVSAAANYLRKNTPQGRRKVVVVISDGEDTNSASVVKAIWDAERKLVNSARGEELRNIRVKARDAAKVREQGRVLQALQNADTVFYSINPAGSSYQLNKISQFGQSNLQRFADETGGAAFLPKFQPTDLKDGYQNTANTRVNQETLTRIFRQLANELQAQYLVQYYSESDFPNNKYVKLDVGLRNPQNFRIRARKGYFVKK